MAALPFQLSDIYIKPDGGNFPITQRFGNKLVLKNAQGVPYEPYKEWGMLGHNGIDIECPSMTPTLSGADGWVKKIGYERDGYGHYIVVVHNGFYTRYAHLNNVAVKVGDRVIAGQLIAYSNNSGKSTKPHLHFEVVPCDESGREIEPGNGYLGRIDPLNKNRVTWNLKGLREPVIQTTAYNQDELAATREEANLNWDCFTGLTSYMGLQANPNDKKGTLEQAKEIVDSYHNENGSLRKTIEGWEKKYNQEAEKNINLLKANKEVSNDDLEYATQARDSQKLVSEYMGYLKTIAVSIGVDPTLPPDKLYEGITKTIEDNTVEEEVTEKTTTANIPVFKVNETIFTKITNFIRQYIQLK